MLPSTPMVTKVPFSVSVHSMVVIWVAGGPTDARGGATVRGGGTAVANDAITEARKALEALGYKPQEATRMARAVAQDEMEAEEIIRLALQSTVTS